MLLSMWMAHCPAAVKIFLNVPGAMAFLTAQTSATEFDSNAELLQGKFSVWVKRVIYYLNVFRIVCFYYGTLRSV